MKSERLIHKNVLSAPPKGGWGVFAPPKGGVRGGLFLLLLFMLALPLDAQKATQKPAQKTTTQKPAQKSTQQPAKKTTKSTPAPAPQSKKVNELKQQQTKLQKEVKDNQIKLEKTKKQVETGEQNVTYLGVQIDNRLTRIHQLEKELDDLESDITILQKDFTKLDGEVRLRRQRLKAAVRNARALKENRDPLVFVLSAKTFSQMYRRARYAKEYVAYQHNLGEQLLQKQAELLKTQNLLLEAKSKKSRLLNEVMLQRRDLNEQQVQERKKVAGLRKQESGLQDKLKEQQKQLAALDKKIEEVIAYEIEQARKKAEEEARKKAAAEAERKKKEAEQKKTASKGTTTKEGTKQGTGTKQTATNTKQTTTPSQPYNTAKDQRLTGSFVQNKGRLPVPITGQYVVAGRFGLYNVPGMKNVQLDNKGINYVGRPGARARAVFDGVVTGVFQFAGSWNVLVRHGAYITVYCNLSSTIVKKGQKVQTRDILGTVANDGSGNCNLHFQIRKETIKLNPEGWIGK